MRAGTDTENLSRRSPRTPHHEGQRREQAGHQPSRRGGLAAQRLRERQHPSGASAGGLGAGVGEGRKTSQARLAAKADAPSPQASALRRISTAQIAGVRASSSCTLSVQGLCNMRTKTSLKRSTLGCSWIAYAGGTSENPSWRYQRAGLPGSGISTCRKVGISSENSHGSGRGGGATAGAGAAAAGRASAARAGQLGPRLQP